MVSSLSEALLSNLLLLPSKGSIHCLQMLRGVLLSPYGLHHWVGDDKIFQLWVNQVFELPVNIVQQPILLTALLSGYVNPDLYAWMTVISFRYMEQAQPIKACDNKKPLWLMRNLEKPNSLVLSKILRFNCVFTPNSLKTSSPAKEFVGTSRFLLPPELMHPWDLHRSGRIYWIQNLACKVAWQHGLHQLQL